MAHFTKLDDQNVVIDINVVSDEIVNNLPFPESEPLGVAFLIEWSGGYINWKQTSPMELFRKNYAAIDYTYDPDLDAFIPPSPHLGWLLNTETCQWDSPIPYPTDGKFYLWNEETQSWVEVAQ